MNAILVGCARGVSATFFTVRFGSLSVGSSGADGALTYASEDKFTYDNVGRNNKYRKYQDQ